MRRFPASHKILLLALLCVFVLTASTGCKKHTNANGLIPITLQTDWYPQPEHGGFYTAMVKGYYKQEGLDVTILPIPGTQGATTIQAVASGNAQFALSSSVDVLEAQSRGVPLIAVGATMQHDPQAVMVHADSPIKSFADLNGHTISDQIGAMWFKYITSKYHLTDVRETPSTLSIANFLNDPNYIQQIFVTSEPFYVEQAGQKCRYLLISNTGWDPYRVFFTSERYAAENPEVVRKFVKASIEGWQEYLRDPAPANALIMQLNPQMNRAQMEYSTKALKENNFISGPDTTGKQVGHFDPARWATLAQQLYDLKIIDKPIDPNKGYTSRFLP